MEEEVECRSLEPGQEGALKDAILSQPFFADDFALCGGRYFRDNVFGEKTWNPYMTKVAVTTNGRIVAQVVVQHRQILVDGRMLDVGAVALVGTVEKYRGRGYAAQLLNMAVKDMVDHGYHASMLFTKNPYFAAKTPWKTVPRVFTLIEPGFGHRGHHQMHSSAQFAPDLMSQRNQLSDIYDWNIQPQLMALRRHNWYWDSRLPNPSIYPPTRCWMFWRGDRLSAYAVYEEHPEAMVVREACWVDPDGFYDVYTLALDLISEKRTPVPVGFFAVDEAALAILGPTQRIERIIQRHEKFMPEDIMMLPLKPGVEIPKSPVMFFPTDHF